MVHTCVARRKQQRPGIAENDRNDGAFKTTNKPPAAILYACSYSFSKAEWHNNFSVTAYDSSTPLLWYHAMPCHIRLRTM